MTTGASTRQATQPGQIAASMGSGASNYGRPVLALLPVPVSATSPGVVDSPTVLEQIHERLANRRPGQGPAVLLLDLRDTRFEVSVLLDTLDSLAREIRAGQYGDVVLVVSSDDAAVRRVTEMVATTQDLPMYVVSSGSGVLHSEPVGRLTPTERESIAKLDQLGGRVTVNTFATATALELTAAGNRLSNLARRGYVHRLARSRRDGDEYVSPISPASFGGYVSRGDG